MTPSQVRRRREVAKAWERANRLMDAVGDGTWRYCDKVKLSPAVLRWQQADDSEECPHTAAMLVASGLLDGLSCEDLP